MVQVLVVDDQAPFRAAARAVIARVQGFELVGRGDLGRGSRRAGRQGPPRRRADGHQHGRDGRARSDQLITTAHPETMVILVSTYTEADMPPDAHVCGAAAYVNKDELSPRVVRRLWEAGGDPAWTGSRA